MFRFENPFYLYTLALLPVMALLHYLTNYRRARRLRAFGETQLLKPLMPDVSLWRLELKFWLLLSAFGMMIVCLARPQYGTKIDTRKRRGIEAIVALDVSNSMLATDVSPSRLDKAKLLISSLVDDMTDDKIGLIVYAGDAFTQLPITSDYVSAKMFLDNISPAMVNVQGTDIARAIELASHSFTQQEGVGRAIFVITDGEDNEGGAESAAAEAMKRGMKVYVLGIGTPEGSPIPIRGSNGYITDNAGNTVVSKLNEQMCRDISQAGGGAYIYVDNSSSAISALQKHVDKLAKADIESVLYSEFDEHFRDFAWAALVLLLIETLILARRNRVLSRFSIFPSAKAALLMLFFLSPIASELIPFSSSQAFAQKKNDRYFIRHGNRQYRDSLYTKAQVNYQKAIEKDNSNAVAHYNLGNAQLMQGQPKEAMQSFETAARMQTEKLRAAQAYHNMGVILQSQKQFKEAIQCYQNALRQNPKDDETRYNLALCLHQLKNQNQDDQGGQDNQQGQDQQKQEQQKQEQQQQKQQQDQQQEQQPEQPKMSKENAEQLLQAAQQEEKQTQDKVNKAQQRPQRRQLEKQW